MQCNVMYHIRYNGFRISSNHWITYPPALQYGVLEQPPFSLMIFPLDCPFFFGHLSASYVCFPKRTFPLAPNWYYHIEIFPLDTNWLPMIILIDISIGIPIGISIDPIYYLCKPQFLSNLDPYESQSLSNKSR